MSINDFLESGANVAITITPLQLKEFALFLIDETLSSKSQEEQPEQYLTPDEAATQLGVTKNTLWRWDKEKYLTPIRIGRKPRYKRTDVISLLNGRN